MRSVFFLSALFLSWSSFAVTNLELISGDYNIRATLTSSETTAGTGSVVATTQNQGVCQGTFVLDLNIGSLKITLDGIQGPNTGGGCHNESMVVDISAQGYEKIMRGYDVPVSFRSIFFYNENKMAIVRKIF